MQMFEYKIEQVLSTHSFDSHQISVIMLSDRQDSLYKGIAVSPIPYYLFSEARYSEAMGDYGKPLIIDSQQALLLCQFIEAVLNGSLPRKIKINTNGPQLRIKLRKYISKWHGGGGYKGRTSFGGFSGFSGFGILSNTTVARNSLIKLRDSLIDLYKLENMAEINA